MYSKIIGAVIGIVFGIVLFWLGVGPAFGVLALALLGWIVGKLANREINIINYIEWISGKRDTRW